MALLDPGTRAELEKRFSGLASPVTIVNFTQKLECRFCEDTRMIMEEVAGLSDKISLEVHNFQVDKAAAEKFHIDKIPATVVMGEKDVGIRFFGIPSGYEFTSLVDSIELVSAGDSGLEKSTRDKLARLDKSLHIQVFVTPT